MSGEERIAMSSLEIESEGHTSVNLMCCRGLCLWRSRAQPYISQAARSAAGQECTATLSLENEIDGWPFIVSLVQTSGMPNL